jgi:hypothetical protein
MLNTILQFIFSLPVVISCVGGFIIFLILKNVSSITSIITTKMNISHAKSLNNEKNIQEKQKISNEITRDDVIAFIVLCLIDKKHSNDELQSFYLSDAFAKKITDLKNYYIDLNKDMAIENRMKNLVLSYFKNLIIKKDSFSPRAFLNDITSAFLTTNNEETSSIDYSPLIPYIYQLKGNLLFTSNPEKKYEKVLTIYEQLRFYLLGEDKFVLTKIDEIFQHCFTEQNRDDPDNKSYAIKNIPVLDDYAKNQFTKFFKYFSVNLQSNFLKSQYNDFSNVWLIADSYKNTSKTATIYCSNYAKIFFVYYALLITSVINDGEPLKNYYSAFLKKNNNELNQSALFYLWRNIDWCKLKFLSSEPPISVKSKSFWDFKTHIHSLFDKDFFLNLPTTEVETYITNLNYGFKYYDANTLPYYLEYIKKVCSSFNISVMNTLGNKYAK